MKKMLSLLLSVVMVLALIPGAVSTAHAAAGNVAINKTNFPDEAFRNYVSGMFDSDEDGYLNAEEIAGVTDLDLDDYGITTLQGVGFFTALEVLWCNNNQLTALDVSSNTALTELWCYGNQLTTLKVSGNAALENLNCSHNQLTSLNLANCAALKILDCRFNQLTALDISNNTALRKLSCYSNSISTLDIYSCPCLLDVYNNGRFSIMDDYYFYVLTNSGYSLAVGKDTEIITQHNPITPPVISAQPVSQTVSEGNTVTFRLEATGTDLTYQWWYLKPGATTWTKVKNNGTSATYRLTTEARHNGYQYKCVVSNAAGTVTSSIVTLTVVTPPSITAQPNNQTVAVGKSATFTVKANGSSLTYQWWYLKPGGEWTKVKVNGTSATYKLTAQERHNGYKYRCRIINSAGSVTSAIVTLTVVTAPTITTQPTNRTVTAGKTATFSVTASGEGLSYQWWYLKPGSATWTKVKINGTSATYKLTAQERHNGYQYKCVITNAAGSVTSKTVKLTVK